MMGVGEDWPPSMTWRSRFSNSPFMLAPACSRPISRVRRVTSVPPPAHEDIHDLPNLFIASDDGGDLSAAGPFRKIDGELLQGLLLAQLGGGHGAAGLARGCTAADLETVGRAQLFLRGAAQEFVEALGQGIDTDLVELLVLDPEGADADPELGLSVPDPGTDDGAYPQDAGGRRLAQSPVLIGGEGKPMPDQLLDPYRELEKTREDRPQSIGMAGLAGLDGPHNGAWPDRVWHRGCNRPASRCRTGTRHSRRSGPPPGGRGSP